MGEGGGLSYYSYSLHFSIHCEAHLHQAYNPCTSNVRAMQSQAHGNECGGLFINFMFTLGGN